MVSARLTYPHPLNQGCQTWGMGARIGRENPQSGRLWKRKKNGKKKLTFNCFHTFYSFFLPHTIILWAMSCPLYDLVIISYSLSPKSHTDRFHFTYYSRKTLSCGKTDLLFKCVVKLLHTDRKMFRCMWPTMENEFDIPALNYLTKSCCLFCLFFIFFQLKTLTSAGHTFLWLAPTKPHGIVSPILCYTQVGNGIMEPT